MEYQKHVVECEYRLRNFTDRHADIMTALFLGWIPILAIYKIVAFAMTCSWAMFWNTIVAISIFIAVMALGSAFLYWSLFLLMWYIPTRLCAFYHWVKS